MFFVPAQDVFRFVWCPPRPFLSRGMAQHGVQACSCRNNGPRRTCFLLRNCGSGIEDYCCRLLLLQTN